jgi:hypothetical protein
MNRALVQEKLAELDEFIGEYGDVPRAYSAAQNSLGDWPPNPDAFVTLARKLRRAADAAATIAVEVAR